MITELSATYLGDVCNLLICCFYNFLASHPNRAGKSTDEDGQGKLKKKKEVKKTPDGKLILDFKNDSDSEDDRKGKKRKNDSDDSGKT